MALSEREQKLLEEMERGLYANDAEFAQRVSKSSVPSPRRMIAGALLAVVGISILVFAVMIQLAIFGLIGFLIMLAGILIASSNMKPTSLEAQAKPQAAANKPSGEGKNPFEERWDRRRGL
jgi:predicted lipid-binding transport protein (Tim44 family)